MASRPVDSPPGVYSSSAAAARWLGLTEKVFRVEAAARPDLLPHVMFGRNRKYHWLDLVCYAWYRQKMANREEIPTSPDVPGHARPCPAVPPRPAPEK